MAISLGLSTVDHQAIFILYDLSENVNIRTSNTAHKRVLILTLHEQLASGDAWAQISEVININSIPRAPQYLKPSQASEI